MAPTSSGAGTGGVIANVLNTQSQTGTTLGNTANSVNNFSAANTTSGPIQLTNMAASLAIVSISDPGTGGNVQVGNSGGITLASTATINAGGTVTLGVGNSAGNFTSLIAGKITSPNQIVVNGGIAANVVNVQLAASPLLGAAGLIFNGGSSGPNVLDITDAAGTSVPANVYCVHEDSMTIFHGPAQAPDDAKLAYNANVQKLEIDGNGGVDNVTVHVANIVNTSMSSPRLPNSSSTPPPTRQAPSRSTLPRRT